jgi:hypothetical protein
MMHPNTQVQSVALHRGHLGVFATADIPRGTFVYVKDDLDVEIDQKQYARLDALRRQHVDTFSYTEATGARVVSWDLAKYVNHSCHPNTMSTGWGPEVAVEDIPAGAEITDEYGLLNIESAMSCSCGSAVCRGQVEPDDNRRLVSFWDELVQAALCFTHTVEQPLWCLIPTEEQRELEAYLAGRAQYRSVAELTHVPPNGAAATTEVAARLRV